MEIGFPFFFSFGLFWPDGSLPPLNCRRVQHLTAQQGPAHLALLGFFLRQAGSCLAAPWPPDATASPSMRQMTAAALRGDKTPSCRPPLSPILSHLSRACSLPPLLFCRRAQGSRHGRSSPPPFRATPGPAAMPYRSASPPSSSPSTESVGGGRNRRRSRRFPCRQPELAAAD
jgi:hypothetical protein